MRSVEDRIEWYRTHRPDEAGQCAKHVKDSLNAPFIHAGSASIAYSKVPPVQIHRTTFAPRGAILYWTGGSDGYGHVALSLGGGDVLSVDVNGPRTVGAKPMQWFAANWPRLIYKGWSWYWGPLNTEEVAVPVDPYIMKKAEIKQTCPLNKWFMADLGSVDKILPPVGANDWDFYANFDLDTLSGAGRNDLRYVLGRWARHDAGSPDAIAGGIDVTGADTKAIPLDLPKSTLRYTWTHGFKGEAGVPVSFWLYIGSMKDGTVVSPLRIFKVDDES